MTANIDLGGLSIAKTRHSLTVEFNKGHNLNKSIPSTIRQGEKAL